MPIPPHLDGHKFDSETIRVMGIAFEMALRLRLRGAPPLARGPMGRASLGAKLIGDSYREAFISEKTGEEWATNSINLRSAARRSRQTCDQNA
jgi:hypothetical protein